MKLERCPLCGGRPEQSAVVDHLICGECRSAWVHKNQWNRLARLVRKGRMFEWLERSKMGGILTTVDTMAYAARDWWRKRRAK